MKRLALREVPYETDSRSALLMVRVRGREGVAGRIRVCGAVNTKRKKMVIS